MHLGYGAPDKPSPAGCVIVVFALMLLVAGIIAVYALCASLATGQDLPWSTTRLVLVAVGCLALSGIGFYAAWRLLKNQGPIDPDGPMVQW